MAGEVTRTPYLRNLLVKLFQETTVNEFIDYMEERQARELLFMNLISDQTGDRELVRIQLLIQLCQVTREEEEVYRTNIADLYAAILACEDEVIHPYREMPRYFLIWNLYDTHVAAVLSHWPHSIDCFNPSLLICHIILGCFNF